MAAAVFVGTLSAAYLADMTVGTTLSQNNLYIRLPAHLTAVQAAQYRFVITYGDGRRSFSNRLNTDRRFVGNGTGDDDGGAYWHFIVDGSGTGNTIHFETVRTSGLPPVPLEKTPTLEWQPYLGGMWVYNTENTTLGVTVLDAYYNINPSFYRIIAQDVLYVLVPANVLSTKLNDYRFIIEAEDNRPDQIQLLSCLLYTSPSPRD